jgi:hypothetical protein
VQAFGLLPPDATCAELVASVTRNTMFEPTLISDTLRSQWIAPGDVYSVLLIVGGDVVARALAQLAGSGLTPVAFSFGMNISSPVRTP